MKVDSRVRALAVPIPKLPSALINIIPVKTNDELEIVEKYLSEPNEDNINCVIGKSFIFYFIENFICLKLYIFNRMDHFRNLIFL